MGMYSTWNDEDFEWIDKRRLRKFLEDNKEDKTMGEYCKDALKEWRENGEFTMAFTDGWKIQGYWYKDFSRFLFFISEFLIGVVYYTYETGTPFNIKFNKGKCIVAFIPETWEEFNITEQCEFTPKEKLVYTII